MSLNSFVSVAIHHGFNDLRNLRQGNLTVDKGAEPLLRWLHSSLRGVCRPLQARGKPAQYTEIDPDPVLQSATLTLLSDPKEAARMSCLSGYVSAY